MTYHRERRHNTPRACLVLSYDTRDRHLHPGRDYGSTSQHSSRFRRGTPRRRSSGAHAESARPTADSQNQKLWWSCDRRTDGHQGSTCTLRKRETKDENALFAIKGSRDVVGECRPITLKLSKIRLVFLCCLQIY